MMNNKFWLYSSVIVGHIFIFGSLLIMVSNFNHQERQTLNQLNNETVNYISELETEINFNTIFLHQIADYLSHSKNIEITLNGGNSNPFAPIKTHQNFAKIDFAVVLDSALNALTSLQTDSFSKLDLQNIKNLTEVQFASKSKQPYEKLNFEKQPVFSMNQTICSPIRSQGKIIGYIWLKRKITSFDNLLNNNYIERISFLFKPNASHENYFLFQIPNSNSNDSNLIFKQNQTNTGKQNLKSTTKSAPIYVQINTQLNRQKALLNIMIFPNSKIAVLDNYFNGIIISVILLVIGLMILFFVISRSRLDYHKLKKENLGLNIIATNTKKYSDLFEFSLMPEIIHQDGKIVLINKAGLQMAEVESSNDIIDTPILNFVHPDYQEIINERIIKLMSGIDLLETQLVKLITLKGKELVVELAAFKTEFHGKPAIHAMMNNITERREFLQKINESEIKYKAIFEQLTDAIMLLKDNKFVDCNDAAVKIFGYSSKKDILNVHPADLSPKFQSDGQSSVEKADAMMNICFQTRFNRFEWQHMKSDGTIFWMDIILTLITIDGNEFIQVIGRDISQIIEINKQLEENKNYLKNLMMRIPIPIVVYSLSHEVTFINDSFIKTFGYSHQEINSIEDWWNISIKNPTKRKEIKENWEKALQNSASSSTHTQQQWTISDKHDRKLDCEFFGIKTDNDVLVVLNNITEIKELNHELLIAKEQAQESNRLKSAFLANLSHELRTPMNGILGFSQLLAYPDLEETERQNYIDLIHKSGLRLLNMINDIIQISKIDSDQIELNIRTIKLKAAIEEIYQFFIPETKVKGLQFDLNLNQLDDAFEIETDEYKLKQVLVNLISNAIKYTEKGWVKIEVHLNENIEISIEDSGVGIDKQNFKRIFERFTRLEVTNNKTDGIGLGLSITKAFVKQMGLHLKLSSEVGKGTLFVLSIPPKYQTLNLNHEIFEAEKLTSPKVLDLNGKTILIAEDDELNFMILKLYLEKTDVKILRAENGKTAIDLTMENNISLIFMDLKMPFMDGFEAMKIIKKSKPHIPVIAQTAFTFSEDKNKCLEAGFDDYLSKPLHREKVYEILMKYFNA